MAEGDFLSLSWALHTIFWALAPNFSAPAPTRGTSFSVLGAACYFLGAGAQFFYTAPMQVTLRSLVGAVRYFVDTSAQFFDTGAHAGDIVHFRGYCALFCGHQRPIFLHWCPYGNNGAYTETSIHFTDQDMDFSAGQCYTLKKASGLPGIRGGARRKPQQKHFRMEETIMIPKDPVMLLSFINLKLRDYYRNLEACCDDLDIDREELTQKLSGIGYVYDEQRNQFV